MQLTKEHQRIVEENHKLIYWYISLRDLNIDEWYDLLAIELCLTVSKHDVNKSTLAHYFKLRADNLLRKEFTKTIQQKRKNNGIISLEKIHDVPSYDNIDECIKIKEILENDTTGILKLKLEGYNQEEIAIALGVTQSYVSKLLRKMRDDFYVDG